MSNSGLVNLTQFSPNCSMPRNGKILKHTPHHMAGNLSIEACANLFSNPARQASSNYVIGSDGRIGLCVDEANRSWATGSAENDNVAITYEVANDGGAPDWHVSDKAIDSLVMLMTDVSMRNGIKSINYTGDANGNLTRHNMFQATACPGPYLQSKFPEIANRVNELLGNGVPTIPQPTTNKRVYEINEVQNVNGIWQLRNDYLVPTDFTWTENGIPLDDVDFTDAQGNILANQSYDGSQQYFTFRIGSLAQTVGATAGTGGYYWCQFNSDNGDGALWLSTWDINDLQYT